MKCQCITLTQPVVVLHLPADFERLPEFRALAGEHGEASATHLLMRLWVELAYAASVNGLGMVGQPMAAMFERSLPAPGVSALLKCGLLKEVDGGYHCHRFAQTNEHLDPAHVPQHIRGANVSKFVRAQRRAQHEVMQQGLLLVPEKFVRPDGHPMSAEESRRCLFVVKTMDNALFRPDRAPHEFTEGLMHDALRLATVWNDDQVAMAAEQIVRNRAHPLLSGMNTEKLLAGLPDLLRRVTPA